jgi:hypothetical protein
MSLDVYLEVDEAKPLMPRRTIYVREGGQTKEITRAEWDRRYPDREPVMAEVSGEAQVVYTANITHNLNKMAEEAGIYKPLWRPDEVGIDKAKQLIRPLRKGLTRLKRDPERFRAFNPQNGWGSYAALVSFVDNYLEACKTYPDARVRVWR